MRDELRLDPALADAFASGSLLRPSPAEPDLVHLARVLARSAGARFAEPPSPAELEVHRRIEPTAHLVFVLLDGLGMNLMERLPPDAFLARRLARSIRATCPSTTACALTSIATGAWPAGHGVTGWFTHLPEHGFTLVTLPMLDRATGKPVSERGLAAVDLFPLPAYHRELTSPALTLLPNPLRDTAYARYSRGGTEALGYASIAEAVDRIVAHVTAGHERSYTHLYVPDVDTACHHDGVAAPEVVELILHIDAELARLRSALPHGARLVVTADHGLLDVPVANHMTLWADDPLMELLVVPPTGDARIPIFHVRDGRHAEFEAAFLEKFGHGMRLVPSALALALGFFGAGEAARARFGDFVAIPIEPVTLHYAVPAPPSAARHRIYLAQHGGLSPDEMQIPLIVA